jgi:predicted small secreted protein
MKRTRKITSIVLAALMVLSALVVSAGNIVRFRGVL